MFYKLHGTIELRRIGGQGAKLQRKAFAERTRANAGGLHVLHMAKGNDQFLGLHVDVFRNQGRQVVEVVGQIAIIVEMRNQHERESAVVFRQRRQR